MGAGAATVVPAKLSTAGDWLALVLFCLLATSSLLAAELYTTFAPEAARARLEQVQEWISSHTDQAIIALSVSWAAGWSATAST